MAGYRGDYTKNELLAQLVSIIAGHPWAPAAGSQEWRTFLHGDGWGKERPRPAPSTEHAEGPELPHESPGHPLVAEEFPGTGRSGSSTSPRPQYSGSVWWSWGCPPETCPVCRPGGGTGPPQCCGRTRQGMTERRYFNVDPDRRSKFWNFNKSTFQIFECEFNGAPVGSIDPLRFSRSKWGGEAKFIEECKI